MTKLAESLPHVSSAFQILPVVLSEMGESRVW
jgi:hypothetical protein